MVSGFAATYAEFQQQLLHTEASLMPGRRHCMRSVFCVMVPLQEYHFAYLPMWLPVLDHVTAVSHNTTSSCCCCMFIAANLCIQYQATEALPWFDPLCCLCSVTLCFGDELLLLHKACVVCVRGEGGCTNDNSQPGITDPKFGIVGLAH